MSQMRDSPLAPHFSSSMNWVQNNSPNKTLMGIKEPARCVKAISAVPITQLEHSTRLLLFPSSAPPGARRAAGGGGSRLRNQPRSHFSQGWGELQLLLQAVGPPTEALGFSGGWQGGKGWAASVFKEAWPALGVGEPLLAL